jgi:hypothetical protein
VVNIEFAAGSELERQKAGEHYFKNKSQIKVTENILPDYETKTTEKTEVSSDVLCVKKAI